VGESQNWESKGQKTAIRSNGNYVGAPRTAIWRDTERRVRCRLSTTWHSKRGWTPSGPLTASEFLRNQQLVTVCALCNSAPREGSLFPRHPFLWRRTIELPPVNPIPSHGGGPSGYQPCQPKEHPLWNFALEGSLTALLKPSLTSPADRCPRTGLDTLLGLAEV
jgi:hypothetical protein